MWLVSRRHCFFMTKRECGERTTPTLPLYSTVYCLDSLFTAKNLTSKLWPPISMHFIEMFLCNIWNSCHVVNTFGSLRLLIKYPLWEPYFWYHWFTLASYVNLVRSPLFKPWIFSEKAWDKQGVKPIYYYLGPLHRNTLLFQTHLFVIFQSMKTAFER